MAARPSIQAKAILKAGHRELLEYRGWPMSPTPGYGKHRRPAAEMTRLTDELVVKPLVTSAQVESRARSAESAGVEMASVRDAGAFRRQCSLELAAMLSHGADVVESRTRFNALTTRNESIGNMHSNPIEHRMMDSYTCDLGIGCVRLLSVRTNHSVKETY
jgi:hypothetical protein